MRKLINNAVSGHSAERGQILIIVAGGLLTFIAMVGLVIDGGHAWGQQRRTQNAADSVAKAGTVVVQHHLAMSGTPTDGDVGCAVEGAADANGVALDLAEYTNYQGQPFSPSVPVGPCAAGGGSSIPSGAQGVKATTETEFDTFLMRVVGIGELTAQAQAIAVVGVPQVLPGGALPVTFPLSLNLCDDTGGQHDIRDNDNDPVWEPYELIKEEDADLNNLAIVPLCDVAPGSVGWLDYECGQNLGGSIADPCEKSIPIPDWVHAQTGNVNCCEGGLNEFSGPASEVGIATDDDSVLALPIHNNTCKNDVEPYAPPPCAAGNWSGTGDTTWFHVPFWIGFKLDQAYTQGGDVECRVAPGSPRLVNPRPAGKVGCLKGWFVDRYDAPGPIGLSQITPGQNVALAIVLID